ncbi:MAG: hypothetical protein AAF518_27920 [Spirochaetota bacterium]
MEVVGSDLKTYSLLVLDPRSLQQTIDEFLNDSIYAIFERPQNNVSGISFAVHAKESAMLLLLLHEGTHIYDVRYGITEHKRLARTIWQNYGTRVVKNTAFSGVRVNFNKKIDLARNIDIYDALVHSNFVSVYSLKSAGEDFAELATFHYLVNELKYDYKISVWNNSKQILVYRPMQNPKVKMRIKHMRRCIFAKDKPCFSK